MCISSRPDNIFQDAFHHCPRLKLENLTYNDIETFVTERFAKERRVQALMRGNPQIMADLVSFIVDTASGVFLWVRLVVHELLRAVRDGATFTELVDKAHEIPGDLDSYFSRFIDSIRPEYRQEASYLFQIVLHDEHSFTSLHGLRLLDLASVGTMKSTLHSPGAHNSAPFDPDNTNELQFRLDTITRRINSRCRGLIECYYVTGDVEEAVGLPELSESSEMDHKAPTHIRSTVGFLRACNHHVGLIHRSLRDFLISPKVFQILEEYSQGPFDTRLFLCRARLAQIQSLDYVGDGVHAQMALGLASYVLSAIGTRELKYSDESALIAAQLRPVVESLGRAQVHRSANQAWYLCSSFLQSQTEFPDFLGVAIDFDLVAYLRKALTAEAINEKRGLSVLNCILLSRFSDYVGSEVFSIGNRFPNIEVLRLALELGADPNECEVEISVWAEFLGYLKDLMSRPGFQDLFGTDDNRKCRHHQGYNQISKEPLPAEAQKAHVEAVRALLEHGAEPELPSSWLTSTLLPLRSEPDLVPVSVVLSEMLDFYSHARQELQECIRLADDRLMQKRANR
ncbi:hypothetical protein J7T55_000378 [Diaporthe amygdali]|uniref:uncharacterized protein n=1 Tax=Phomopsis amygdali TaxID=1214568 RepID=UPI0022FE3FCE|nr:uncharacterized protein J7T55_000378 [Diaporthe amygdali]KAJ0109453.1 hypothetical protein J7T55_000378 [Diaporthe amygdali]